MNETWIGEVKALEFEGKLYPDEEELRDCITQSIWAKKILAAPPVVWENGRNSHDAAEAVMDKAQDALFGRCFFTL